MKVRSLLPPLLYCALLSAGAAAGEIKVSYPSEGDSLPQVKNTFIFGNVSPSTAPFLINGQKISVHRNGGFLAYVPVSEGDFSFNCELLNGATVTYARKVKVKQAAPPRVSTGPLKLEIVSPSADLELFPGDYLNVVAYGNPSHSAMFSVAGAFKDAAMAEFPKGSGRYVGSYRVKASDSVRNAQLTVKFRKALFGHGASAAAKARVSMADSYSVLETSTDAVILRGGPEAGYTMFLPKGVRLVSDGRQGAMRRVRLSPGEAAWVDESRVAASPDHAFAPVAETGALRFRKTDAGSSGSLYLPEKVPFVVEERENSLKITLYYAKARTNTIVYDSSDTFVAYARVAQSGENSVTLEIELDPAQPLWGYDVSYGFRALNVDLKKAPALSRAWPRPLEGLRAVVDAGHSPKQTPPYDGAIGPMGTFEYQVNLMTAWKLNETLSALGATVYMIRRDTETVQLSDRPKLAKEWKGDLYVSLHNNALPDGEDPFAVPRGFSVYHYHRHSLPLARAVHRSYLKNVPLPDEGLRYGDYAVARLTSMPAILLESAYMIFPEQEEMLNDPQFQQKLADTVAAGLLDYLKIPPMRVIR